MKKILVIEDNIELREEVVSALEMEGYKALTADNGEEGLICINKSNPDLILCDIMMPVMDGYEVIDALKLKKEIVPPFIFVTALGEREDYRKGMEDGADDFLVKPFTIDEMLRAIKTQLAKSNKLDTAIRSKIDRLEKEFQQHIWELEERLEHQEDIIDEVYASKGKIEEDLNEKHAQLMNEALRAIEFNTTLKDMAKEIDHELLRSELNEEYRKTLTNLRNRIRRKSGLLNNWTVFQMKFDLVYPKLKLAINERFPKLTAQDKLLISGIYSSLNTNQMAEILNIQPSSIRKYKYRLKKKMGLNEGDEILSLLQQLGEEAS